MSNLLVLEIAPSDGYMQSNVVANDAVLSGTTALRFITASNAAQVPLSVVGSNVIAPYLQGLTGSFSNMVVTGTLTASNFAGGAWLPSNDGIFSACNCAIGTQCNMGYSLRTYGSIANSGIVIARSSAGATVAVSPSGLSQASQDYASNAAATASPTGQVSLFAMSNAPTGWLECNGTAVSRSTYATLFGAIGTLYGAGNGSTTFNVPELRGEFMRGWDHARGIDSARAFGSWQSNDVQPHTHPMPSAAGGGGNGAIGGMNASTTYATLSNSGTETRPRNVALLPCIKT